MPNVSADSAIVGLVVRHRLSAALVAGVVVATAGFFVFARPEYRQAHQGTNVKVPEKQPAADAAGRAGWTWPDGVPGWTAGYTLGGVNLSEVQPIETQPAAIAAAHDQLDASQLRVVDAQHVILGEGPLAIFAATMAGATSTIPCLTVVLPASDDVTWRCAGSGASGDYAHSRVILGFVSHRWSNAASDQRRMFALVGLARGDVRRVELHISGATSLPTDNTLYERGTTWGQFDANVLLQSASEKPELRIYGNRGLVQTIRLRPAANEQRVIGRATDSRMPLARTLIWSVSCQRAALIGPRSCG